MAIFHSYVSLTVIISDAVSIAAVFESKCWQSSLTAAVPIDPIDLI
jgi:hypothetical protein